jgi:curved DNA-binding protein CbpA
MAAPTSDPYKTLGVSPGISDADLRAAYHRLVQLHHPDHNGGSAEAARRFEEIQEAYARIKRLRASGKASTAAEPGPRTADAPPRARQPPTGSPPRARPRATDPPPRARPRPAKPPPRVDADRAVDSRLADLERELREAQAASERARREAREAVAESTGRPSDEELGYVTTDDSFGKILADAGSELAARFSQASERLSDEADKEGVAKRVSDLLEELEHLTSKSAGDPKRKGDQ